MSRPGSRTADGCIRLLSDFPAAVEPNTNGWPRTVRYGLSPAVVRDFVQAGLLRPAPAPDAVLIDEPDDLPRLARFHHELDLAPEALDIILAMRQRLVQLQAALVHETARPA